MNSKRVILSFMVASAAVVFLFQNTFSISIAAAADVDIICNKSMTENTLHRSEIKDIFLGKKSKWSDGKKIVFVTLKESKVHNAFLRKFIGKTAYQYAIYWKKMVFTGKGSLPRSLTKEKDLVDFVASMKGAIGYVSSETAKDGVKIVSR